MDRSLHVEGEILFQAGTHQDAVRLNFRDWYELVNPQVATFSEPGEPAPSMATAACRVEEPRSSRWLLEG
jgi:hypothetical protein